MNYYSVQARDKNSRNNIAKHMCIEVENILRHFLIMRENLLQMPLKLLQKEQCKNKQKQLVIWLIVQLLIKSGKSWIRHHNIPEVVESDKENMELDREIPKEKYISPEKR